MNNERRKELKKELEKLKHINIKISNNDFSIIDDVNYELDDIKCDEESKLDNLNGGLLETQNAYNIQKAIENLDRAMSSLDEFMGIDLNIIEELIIKLEQIE